MKITNKTAIFGLKSSNVAPVVRKIFVDENGDEIVKLDGTVLKVEKMKNNSKLYFKVYEKETF